jgi:hypothetical protein
MSGDEQLVVTKRRVREQFVLFEHKEGSKVIPAAAIPDVVRAMGYNPTAAQCQQLQQRLEMAGAIDDSSHVALEHYEGVVAGWLLDSAQALRRDDVHTLLRAFRSLDEQGLGYLQVDALQVGWLAGWLSGQHGRLGPTRAADRVLVTPAG